MPDCKIFTTRRVRELLPALAEGAIPLLDAVAEITRATIALASCRALIHFSAEALERRARDLSAKAKGPLYALPVSVKDIMDVAGSPTTCGSKFYADETAPPTSTAPFVEAWEARGALLTGKTHLNEFAYGITGENPWFGDCTIPGLPQSLAGGSSSGAAASVAGGAACVALGTDTGGSLRVPAALCGLVSIRAPGWFRNHHGILPLAPSFDALGWMQRFVGDLGTVARGLGVMEPGPSMDSRPFRVAFLEGKILQEVEAPILAASVELRSVFKSAGCEVGSLDAFGWEEALHLFGPIQAREAYAVHERWLKRYSGAYSPAVLARLRWGEKIADAELAAMRERCHGLVEVLSTGFRRAEILVLPATPFTSLRAGEDHGDKRARLIRLTAPASLGNWPVLTIPWRGNPKARGTGFQLIAAPGGESRLVQLAERLSPHLPGE